MQVHYPTLSCQYWIVVWIQCHLAPTFWSQRSQPLTLAQVRRSCLAKCPLCLFLGITHAASLLWIFHTLPPFLLSSAPAPLAVLVYTSTRQHTWQGTQRVCLSLQHFFMINRFRFFHLSWVYRHFRWYMFVAIQQFMIAVHKAVTHTLMESCCVEEFLPSVETEGIWGFNRAIDIVGGVSLVIFFSSCKDMDSKT